jgi:hypothetical protein
MEHKSTSPKSLRVIFVVVIGLIFLIASGCGGSSESDNNNDDDDIIEPLDHNAMLKALGVNTSIGTRLNPAGDPVPVGYNPTLRKVTQLAKRSEIFLAGTRGQGGNASWTALGQHHVALDWNDGATDFTSSNMSGDDSWLTLLKTMASGDLDGDGKDEILVAYQGPSTQAGYTAELALKVIKKTDASYSVIADKTVKRYVNFDITDEYPRRYWYMNNFNAVCGDVDGNGQSETLVAFNGSLFLIGDSEKGYEVLNSIDYTKSGDTRYRLLKISAGDLDSNGTDEFVVVENMIKSNEFYGTAVYHIYAGATLEELASGTLAVSVPGETTYVLHSSNCAVGDLDADGLNEIMFIGERENSAAYWIFVLEPNWNEDAGEFEFSFRTRYAYAVGRDDNYLTPVCAIADFDGDGKKDILGYRYIYENLSVTGGIFTKKQNVEDVYDPVYADAYGSAYDCSLAVGDFDGDLKTDICYITDAFYELYCLGFNNAGQWVRKGTGNITDGSDSYYSAYETPFITMGDFDGDSIAVQFEKSETLFSDPHPVAVMASNPFWSGVAMDGETSFGTATGNTVEKEKAIGFSTRYTIGYESDFGIWSASVKASFEQSFDWTAIESETLTESYTYSTVSEDKVIFTTVPYDVYYYKVIQAPVQNMIGKMLTVNLPRKPITLPVERSFYNANNGESPDVGSSVLTHTIGDPISYPNTAEASQLITDGGGEGVKSRNMMTVGQGSGSETIAMSVTNAEGTGSAISISVEIEAEVGVGGFTAGITEGFHYGESYTVTASTSTLYTGKVNNIPAANWNISRAFSWGLFSYKTTLGSEKFIVLQYYTE